MEITCIEPDGATCSPGLNPGYEITYDKIRNVKWGSHSTPDTLQPGAQIQVPITLTNRGSLTWPNGGLNPVNVTYHWYDASWQIVEWGTGLRSSLPQEIATGQTITVTATLKAPTTPGIYNLLWDMVQEGVVWFSAEGAPLLTVPNLTVAN